MLEITKPNGDTQMIADMNELTSVMASPGFWDQSDDMTIAMPNTAYPRLLVFFAKGRGYYMEIYQQTEDFDPMIPSTAQQGVVELSVGGESHRVPASAVVDPVSAKAVFSDFMAKRVPSAAVSWIQKSQVEWPEQDI